MRERVRSDQAIVYVVDDEPSIRNSTKELAESVGLRVQTFARRRSFFAVSVPAIAGREASSWSCAAVTSPSRRASAK